MMSIMSVFSFTPIISTICVFFILFILDFLAVCEIMWKNVVEPYRPQMTLSYDACALHAG
jgi:hypothetical protein